MIINQVHFKYWVVLFLCYLIAAPPADAVDCAPPSPGSCHFLKNVSTVFVGTLISKNHDLDHFRIDELIKGKHRKYIDLFPFPEPSLFQVGEQYLVFVTVVDGNTEVASWCMPNYQAKYAKALLQQLRAEKNGKRNASVYGMLRQATDIGILDNDYNHPLPNVTIKLNSGGKIFEAKTDKDGVYSFDRLPRGTYQVSAVDMPPHLELSQLIAGDPFPPFELPPNSCFDDELTALPTGRIGGHVFNSDGNPIVPLGLELFRANEYMQSKSGRLSHQGGSESYYFKNLPSGDYVLVFNRLNLLNPDAPFAITFYPNAPNFNTAQIIHLEDGQQITNADIHLGKPIAQSRNLIVRLLWGKNDPQEYFSPYINVHPSWGLDPSQTRVGENRYTMKLLLDASYVIYGEAWCKIGKGSIQTNAVTANKDLSASQITLIFKKGSCIP